MRQQYPFFLGEKESAIVILVVITMNAILGTVQTIKAEHSLNSLKALSSPNAKVLRGGVVVEIPSREVTVGDEVHLEAGDFVPADGRLIESASLKVDESALTGESLGVDKITGALEGELPWATEKHGIFRQLCHLWARYLSGDRYRNEHRGGQDCRTSEKYLREKTPLQVNLDKFGQKLSVMILALCAVLFGLQVVKGGQVADAFLLR